MTEASSFSGRLRIALKGETVNGFAKRSGVPEGSLRQYLNGTMPGIDKAELIAVAAGVSLDWLIANRPSAVVDGATDRYPGQEISEARDFTLVPRFDVAASAGPGLFAQTEEITERLAFKTAWLHDMGLQPAQVGLVTCRGDSQDPIIKDGALMLVDMSPHQSIRSGCFYVIVLDGDVLVKRVNRRIDGSIELLSANPAYPTEIVDSQQLDKLTIPGRVVWAGQKL